jgi:predicted secreted protein
VASAADFYEFDLDDPYSPVFNGQPVPLKVGDSVRFVVDENLSTGYQWKYKSNAERGMAEEKAVYVVEFTKAVEHQIIYDAENGIEEPLNGAGSTRIIQLKATKPGADVFEMVYVRTWEIGRNDLYAAPNAGHHKIAI